MTALYIVLPLALLVVSDGGYGMLRYDQTVAGDPHRGVDLVEPRWEDLASAYGFKVVRTDDPASLNARLVSAGVRVRALQPERHTLEDTVLALTSDGSDRITA